MTKDKIVQQITDRINNEYRKYHELPDLDWSGIAARKIFMTLKELNLLTNIEE